MLLTGEPIPQPEDPSKLVDLFYKKMGGLVTLDPHEETLYGLSRSEPKQEELFAIIDSIATIFETSPELLADAVSGLSGDTGNAIHRLDGELGPRKDLIDSSDGWFQRFIQSRVGLPTLSAGRDENFFLTCVRLQGKLERLKKVIDASPRG
ncbi:MAG: hypothetical protein WA021_05585 [Minisyncoccia bacterium]